MVALGVSLARNFWGQRMLQYRRESLVGASSSEVFEWHARAGALERLTPPWSPVRVIARSGRSLQAGTRVILRVPIGPFGMRWVAEHGPCVPGRSFSDRQIAGPFAAWEHEHRFEPLAAGESTLVDEVRYALPGGLVQHPGAPVGAPGARSSVHLPPARDGRRHGLASSIWIWRETDEGRGYRGDGFDRVCARTVSAERGARGRGPAAGESEPRRRRRRSELGSGYRCAVRRCARRRRRGGAPGGGEHRRGALERGPQGANPRQPGGRYAASRRGAVGTAAAAADVGRGLGGRVLRGPG